MLGLRIGRELLELDGLTHASPQRIADLMRPCFEAMTTPAHGVDARS
jgi:hypothetical protein